MSKPYVVSADIRLLLESWAVCNGFVTPAREFFSRLREEFSSYMRGVFPGFELVSEDEILDGLTSLATGSGLPVLSLDRVYLQSDLRLDIARLVDEARNDCGLGHRAGTLPLLQQMKNLHASGVREVTLADDVIFTGSLIVKIIDLLSRAGIRVPFVCAGIGIAGGIEQIGKTGAEVRCVRVYEEVVDEVCERDFYPGVPLSGRLLARDGNTGLPYLLPFGKPEEWASIPPAHAIDFSRFCLHQTTRLFEEIERRSGRKVACNELGRKAPGLPDDDTRFVDALRAIRLGGNSFPLERMSNFL